MWQPIHLRATSNSPQLDACTNACLQTECHICAAPLDPGRAVRDSRRSRSGTALEWPFPHDGWRALESRQESKRGTPRASGIARCKLTVPKYIMNHGALVIKHKRQLGTNINQPWSQQGNVITKSVREQSIAQQDVARTNTGHEQVARPTIKHSGST